MNDITLLDPAWQSTFPHRVSPLQDEWLPGFLLRCDEANGWESGTTLHFLLQYIQPEHFTKRAPFIVVPTELLEYLAQCLKLPLDCLLATTYHHELARLYNTPNPYAPLLSVRRVSFHICPACVEQKRLLRRTLTLPNLYTCPVHRIKLCSMCRCGNLLVPFSEYALPFTCVVCGLNWADLSRLPISSYDVARQNQIASLYQFLLTKGTPGHIERAAGLLRRYVRSEGRTNDPVIKRRFWVSYGTKPSLGSLVERMVPAGFTADNFLTYWG